MQGKKWLKKIKWINIYFPYLFSGIRVKISPDDNAIIASMKLKWYNKNLVGTHFGGSLYSMCDPHFMFLIMINLGKDYIVWDQAASIRFKKPGKGKVSARFYVSPEEIARIRDEVEELGKKTFRFYAEVKNEAGEVVAEVDKDVYVRKKRKVAQTQGAT